MLTDLISIIEQIYDRNIYGYWSYLDYNEEEKARFIYTSLYSCRKYMHVTMVWFFLSSVLVFLEVSYLFFRWPLVSFRQGFLLALFGVGCVWGFLKTFQYFQKWEVEKCFLVFALLADEELCGVFSDLLEKDNELRQDFLVAMSFRKALGFT